MLENFCDSKNLIYDDDVIFYQTWPDDRIFEKGNINKPILDQMYEKNGENHPKYPKVLIERADKFFFELHNKVKILVDLHDDGDQDAFSRFIDNKYPFIDMELKKNIDKMPLNYFYEIPRVKNTPSVDYKLKFNVIFDVTYITKINTTIDLNNMCKRKIMFHYYANDKNNKVRPIIKNILKNDSDVSCEIIDNYPQGLLDVFAEINVPGYGKGCFRHIDSLNFGCLVLAYEDIKNTYLLPNYILVEDEDYILFNENNILSKINWIKNNNDKVNKIKLSGYEKFKKFYDLETNARILKNTLNKLIML